MHRPTGARAVAFLVVALGVAVGPVASLGGVDAGPGPLVEVATPTENDDATWRVSDVEVQSENVTQGEPIGVALTLTSFGDGPDTRPVSVHFYSSEPVFEVTKNVTVGPDADVTVTFELPTERVPPGSYSVFATAPNTDGERSQVDVVPEEDGAVHYQVDLVQGPAQSFVGPDGVDPFYGERGKLIRFLHGSTDEPVTRGGSPGSNALNDSYSDCVDSRYIEVDEEENVTSVTFTVADGCEVRLTLATYLKPDGDFDRGDLQVLFDREGDTFGPGTHTLTVELPTEEDYESRVSGLTE